jgi:hypothetical protein
MPVPCEGALILEQLKIVGLLKKNAEREILALQSEIYARKELIEKLEEKTTVLINMHQAVGYRPDPGVMEFTNDAFDEIKGA